MEKRDQHKGADASGLSAAFSEFVINAQAGELKEAIEAAGMEPDVLARQGRAIAERVLNRHRGDAEESARQLQEAKALREGLSALLQLLRRREGMSQDELAATARRDSPDRVRLLVYPEAENHLSTRASIPAAREDPGETVGGHQTY